MGEKKKSPTEAAETGSSSVLFLLLLKDREISLLKGS